MTSSYHMQNYRCDVRLNWGGQKCVHPYWIFHRYPGPSFESACLNTLILVTALNLPLPPQQFIDLFQLFLHEWDRNLQSSLCLFVPNIHLPPILLFLFPLSFMSSQACTKVSACQMARRAGSPWAMSSRSQTSTWGGETSGSATGSCGLPAWSLRATPSSRMDGSRMFTFNNF